MTETLSIRLDSDVKRRLDALAERTSRSKSFLAAEAIAVYLSSEEWQLGEIHAGIKDLNEGRSVNQQAVAKWLRAWGKKAGGRLPR